MAWQRVVGVYDADGGLVGESRYVIGKVLGRAHCALCDITHSPVRRKREWDRLLAELGVPLEVVHRNEQDEQTAEQTRASGLPVVVGFSGAGAEVLIGPQELMGLDGSVARFAKLLGARLRVEPMTPGSAGGTPQ